MPRRAVVPDADAAGRPRLGYREEATHTIRGKAFHLIESDEKHTDFLHPVYIIGEDEGHCRDERKALCKVAEHFYIMAGEIEALAFRRREIPSLHRDCIPGGTRRVCSNDVGSHMVYESDSRTFVLAKKIHDKRFGEVPELLRETLIDSAVPGLPRVITVP